MINIGQFIYLKEHPTDVDSYRCKVIDKDNKSLIVDLPVHRMTNKSTYFQFPKTFAVSFTIDEASYEFIAKIKRYNKLSLPALIIQLPPKDDIKRIQRRKFVRVRTDVDIAVHCPKLSFSPIVTVTENISGGGAAIIVPKTDCFYPNQKIDVYFILNFGDHKYEYIYSPAKVIRSQERERVKTISIKFLFKDNNSQEQIIQFCFLKQRELRKKNIL